MPEEQEDIPSFELSSSSDHKFGPGFEYDDDTTAEAIRNGPIRQMLREQGIDVDNEGVEKDFR